MGDLVVYGGVGGGGAGSSGALIVAGTSIEQQIAEQEKRIKQVQAGVKGRGW